jgi:hypothetical protein
MKHSQFIRICLQDCTGDVQVPNGEKQSNKPKDHFPELPGYAPVAPFIGFSIPFCCAIVTLIEEVLSSECKNEEDGTWRKNTNGYQESKAGGVKKKNESHKRGGQAR